MQFSSFNTPQEVLEAKNLPWVLIYKHSSTCIFSTSVYGTLGNINFPGVAKLITVQAQRHISDYVTHTFGIPHGTPQVIILQFGVVKKVMNGSGEITAANIQMILNT